VRVKIQQAWAQWTRQADWSGQSDFYGLQALAAREIFEGGEVFSRYRLRPAKDRLFIPLQLQLMEGEQLPVFLNILPGDFKNMVRCGIEFDSDGRRVAYHFYKEHPGETMFYPLSGLQYVEIPAEEIRHIYKPLRIGQLRGEPHMTAVLALLYELEQYSDAELVRKKVAAMFAGFITKPAPEDQVMTPAPNYPTSPGLEDPLNPPFVPQQDIGTNVIKLEPGTMQQLFPGEGITFPSLPQAGDFSSFISTQAHKFAAGINMTYEQVTMDLGGVNYSSIRAGLLEFRRACEQFQYNVIVHQFCEPVKQRWMKEAVLSGALKLGNAYFDNPYDFENCEWVSPGWQWVDPLKEVQAAQTSVRCGFTSRARVVRESGLDPETVDNEQAVERQRAADLGTIYDSDPNKVLIGRETQPETPTTAAPTQDSEEEAATNALAPSIHGEPITERPQ
jgi:lambda family phage portal protein